MVRRIRIVVAQKSTTMPLPCGLSTHNGELSVVRPGDSCEIGRIVSAAGAAYLVAPGIEAVMDGRQLICGLARLTPGSHRIVLKGLRATIEVPPPAVRFFSTSERPIEECPVHHGPVGGELAECERCGFLSCAECARAAKRCPRCGLEIPQPQEKSSI